MTMRTVDLRVWTRARWTYAYEHASGGPTGMDSEMVDLRVCTGCI